MACLRVLRQYCLDSKLNEIQQKGDVIKFGTEYVFNSSTQTAFKSQQNSYYKLDSVVNLIKNSELQQADYFQQLKRNNIEGVTYLDRKDLISYLNGTTDKSNKINQQLLNLPINKKQENIDNNLERIKDEKFFTEGPLQDNAILQEDNLLLRIKSHEKQLRDRNTMLKVPNRTFEPILAMEKKTKETIKRKLKLEKEQQKEEQIKKAKLQQEQQLKKEIKNQRNSGGKVPPVPQLPVVPSNRYQRENPANAELQKIVGSGYGNLNINQYGMEDDKKQQQAELQDSSKSNMRQGTSQQDKVNQGKDQKYIQDDNKKLQNVTEIHSSTHHRPVSHSKDRHHSQTQQQQQRRNSQQNGHQNYRSSHHSHNDKGRASGHPDYQHIPIILVPTGVSAKINMLNAKQFFEEGIYQPIDSELIQNTEKKSIVGVKRKSGRQQAVNYHVTDRIPPHNSKDWGRIVAVVAQGVKWQFKDWPFKGVPEGDFVDLFNTIKGFYFRYHDENVDNMVKSWNVKILSLNKSNRHSDIMVLEDFYQSLDKFLKFKKSRLIY